MKYFSTRNKSLEFSFKDIFLRGLAPDGGLFLPSEIKKYNHSELKNILTNCKFVIQKFPKGTADAIEVAKSSIKTKNFIILFGDVPLITGKALKKLINSFKKIISQV